MDLRVSLTTPGTPPPFTSNSLRHSLVPCKTDIQCPWCGPRYEHICHTTNAYLRIFLDSYLTKLFLLKEAGKLGWELETNHNFSSFLPANEITMMANQLHPGYIQTDQRYFPLDGTICASYTKLLKLLADWNGVCRADNSGKHKKHYTFGSL